MTTTLKFKKQADGSYGLPKRITAGTILKSGGAIASVGVFAAFLGYSSITSDQQAADDKQALRDFFGTTATTETYVAPKTDIIGDIIRAETPPQEDQIGQLIRTLDLQ